MTTRTFDRPRAQTGNEVFRWLSEQRQQQILKIAERQFAASGFASTSTIAVAKAAGISEAMLHNHFGTKQKMFQKVVERNSQHRLAALRKRFFSIQDLPPLECIESMAQSTILACVVDTGNASVMAWGLMETQEFAADVYRAELGATEALWNAEIGTRCGDAFVRSRLTVHLVPYAVHACMAFGLWLATLRHKPATAQAHARQYASAVVYVARAILNTPPVSFEGAACLAPAQCEVA